MKKSKYALLALVLVIGSIAVLANFFKLNPTTGAVVTVENEGYAAGTCTAGQPFTYVVTNNLNVRSAASTSATVVRSLSKNEEVSVYCTTGSWGKVSATAEEYASLNYMNKKNPSYTIGNITQTPATFYRNKSFSGTLTISNITNVPGDTAGRFSASVVNSSGGDASAYISVTKSALSGKSITVTFSKSGTVPADTYYLVIKFDGSEQARRAFTVHKNEFDFDLNASGPDSVAENEAGVWNYSVSNLTPSSLTIDDFDVTINRNGTDYTSSFDIAYKDGYIEVRNKARVIGNISGLWGDMNSNYTRQGTYTVSITLKDKNDYASDKVPNHTKTSTIKISNKAKKITEITTERKIARYAIDYLHLDFDIDFVSITTVSGIKRYTINENNADGTFTQVTYTQSEMKETYPNIDLSQIYTDSRAENKITVDYGNAVYIVNYLDNNVTFYEQMSSTPQVLPEEEFAILYPSAYEKLKSPLYRFDEEGNILYHQTGTGTKIVKKVAVVENQTPQAITGGEIKLKLQFTGYLTSELTNFKATLVKETGNKTLIANAGELVYDSNFEMVTDFSSEFDQGIIYITIKYTSNRDEYISSYKVNYGYGSLTNSSTFELLDGKTDYTVYSELDPGQDTDDPLIGISPSSNKKYDYNIGFYMKKTKVDYDKIELDSLGYQIFDKRVDLDEDGNYIFFDEIEYITKVKRIANNKVYFDLSTDNGETYLTNQELSIAEFKKDYSEAFEYFKDYAEGKTTLKYYNLDANGNVISDNYSMHPVRMYAATETATDMTIDYLDADGVLHTELMEETFKRTHIEMYSLISTRFGYDAKGNYILGAIRGRRQIKEDANGKPLVGQEVTDQFYVRVNRKSGTDGNYGSVDKTLTILPKTEVAPGEYYIYIVHGGSQAVGYLYTDNSADAAIDLEIYPELWNRNIHMTSFKYGNPTYNVSIEEPVITNSVSNASIAYANVESYFDFDLTLKYIYDMENFSYRIEKKGSNGNWETVEDYFNVNAELHPSLEITDLTYESRGLTSSTIKLTTIPGQTKKGEYRLVFDYTNNGVKMPSVTKEFAIRGNHYGMVINQNEIEKDSFYSNYGDTIYIPIHAYSIDTPDNIEFVLEYENEKAEEIWDKAKRQFKNYKNNNVIFNYSYTIEQVDEEESIILLALKNYEGSGKPLADEGKYNMYLSYQEPDGELADASFTFRVDEPQRGFSVTKDKATARSDEMFITRSLVSEYVVGSRLVGDEISYKIEMYKSGVGYVDVSSESADSRLFTISTTWENTDVNDRINYDGSMKINLDMNKIDAIFDASDNQYFMLVITLANQRYELEMPNLRELFKWHIEDVKITGTIENDGETVNVEGFYNNANPKLDILLDTIHEGNANYLITNVCTSAEACTPNENMINFNDKFDLISQSASEIVLKLKDNLANEDKLARGRYQVVVYYSQTDFDVFNFVVRNEYLSIEFGDIQIKTQIRDGYSEELFTNKDSVITIPVKIIGASYDSVTTLISNDDGSVSYNHMFEINNDKFINEHILEIKYDSKNKVEPIDYLLMVSKESEGEIIEDHQTFHFNSTYFNYNVTGIKYNPDPAVPNYEDGGEIIFDISTDELMIADTIIDNEYRSQFVEKLIVLNSDNTDVTEEFKASYKVTSSTADFQVILRYANENHLAPGEYKAIFNVTKEDYTIEKTSNFVMGDYERRITITDVVIDSLSRDNLIHRNVGGTYIVNYITNEMHTEDLYVRVTNAEGTDVTDKFIINKDDAYRVDVKFDPERHTIDYGVYTITLTYADPITHNDDVKSTDVIMYGDYKEISIKDITRSTFPIIAENENQYYQFTLDTDNLTEDDIKNMKVRIYDDSDNIVYSDLPADAVDNIFEVIKNADNTYNVNILPYKARVGAYYVSLILPEAFGLYNISNRLTLTVDDTLYKVYLDDSSIIETSERINGKDDIYDYIGVDGKLNFETTSPIENEYSIKIFNNLKLIKEIPVDANNIDYYKQILFSADEISNGEVEFALCIRGLPYASITKEVLEYIKVTELAVILDNRDVIDEITLNQGDEKEFELYIRPENATNKNLIFTSSDSNVATFLGNKVIIHESGSTTVTVKNKEISQTFTINVATQVQSAVYEIDQDKKTIFISSLKQTILPKNEFIRNLINLNENYKILSGDNEDITASADVVGTNYKLVSGNLTYTVILIGDVNGSGTIDMGDVTYLNRINNGYISPNEIIYKAARILKQDSVNNGDVTKLYRFFLGRINEI